ncbi:cysteine--tRNA ligase, partial [Candidatus Falkowbacteria bacterium]|nr:cysteine--tRNA ligase [Candidatus Falkowbacteria bacterium]
MRLYNTLKRKKETFVPLRDNVVGLYTCGPTVYNYAHIGNLRAYVFADILKRSLKFADYKVKHVMNITDVGHLVSDADSGEDKMQLALKREGLKPSVESLLKLADKYTKSFKADFKDLNIIEPDTWSKATQHVKEMVGMNEMLEKNGYTYETDLALYFDISKFKDYTKLSRQKLEDKNVGVRDEVEIDKGKKHPADFALWFKMAGKNRNHIMHWPSPWGEGFPGWHIECSAMSTKYLGDRFDIHTGGIDHIATHHTNEIAQNDGAYGHQVVNFWMHNEFLVVGSGIKMAKSGGDFLTLEVLKEKGYNPLAYRYLALNTHYRKQMQFSWEAMDGAENSLDELDRAVRGLHSIREKEKISQVYKKRFLAAVNDDLDMPKALAIVWDLVDDSKKSDSIKKATLLEFDKVLGIRLPRLETSSASSTSTSSSTSTTTILFPEEDKQLIEERNEARKEKKWNKSDKLRDEIEKRGYIVEDSKDKFDVKFKIDDLLKKHGFVKNLDRNIFVNKKNKTVISEEYLRWNRIEKIDFKKILSKNTTDDVRWFGDVYDDIK